MKANEYFTGSLLLYSNIMCQDTIFRFVYNATGMISLSSLYNQCNCYIKRYM